MDVEHHRGGCRISIAALKSLAVLFTLVTIVGCGSGDDEAVGGNSTTGTDGSPDQAVADAPSEAAVEDVASEDAAHDGGPADAGRDATEDAPVEDVSVVDAAEDVTKDSYVADVALADVAADVAHDSGPGMGSDASEAGKDASIDAAPVADAGTVVTEDTGTVVTEDAGTIVTEDAGTVVTEDAGTVVAEDAGTVVTEDAGTVAAEDAGTVVTEDAEADSSVEDAGIDSSPVTGSPDATVTGGCVSAADCPAPTSDCRVATCTVGVCGTADRSSGATCASGGGTLCNGNGACVQCLTASNCAATGTTCRTSTCIGGVCGAANTAAASACTDHGGAVCDGAGDCVQCLVARDCPMQMSACRTNTCLGNLCGTGNTTMGSACNDNGGLLCDGNGSCVSCLAASDCPAQTTACKTNTCVAHACSAMNTMLGVACTDSGGVACDGNGSCVADHCSDGVKDADETDVDCGGSCGATCTDSPVAQMCMVGGDCISLVCGGPGPTTVCQPPSCTDGVKNGAETDVDCGGPACDAAGHTCADLAHCAVSADCTNATCFGNGLGMCVSCTDGVMDGNETDVDCGGMECDSQNRTCGPSASCDSADDCTGSTTACTGTVYSTGATCTTNQCVAGTTTDCAASGMVCTPATGCVACNVAADCPATGSECIAATCTANTCGTQFLDNTVTVSVGQTSGDCQKLVCDGAGGTVQVDNPSDPPFFATVCEVGSCAGEPLAPVITFAATGTSCTADNQPPNQVCGDTTVPAIAGTCVQCNVDADCAALSLTVCTANVCH